MKNKIKIGKYFFRENKKIYLLWRKYRRFKKIYRLIDKAWDISVKEDIKDFLFSDIDNLANKLLSKLSELEEGIEGKREEDKNEENKN